MLTVVHVYEFRRLDFLEMGGWTLERFKQFGSKELPITTYNLIDTRIAEFDFEASLIIAGFGQDDAGPSVLTVRNPGLCTDHTKLGFWAVGSGATLAQTSLFYREYSWGFSIEKALYMIYEAKTLAEAAMEVGPATHIFIMRKGIVPIGISPASMEIQKKIHLIDLSLVNLVQPTKIR